MANLGGNDFCITTWAPRNPPSRIFSDVARVPDGSPASLDMAAIIAAPTDNETAIAAMARDSVVRSVRVSKTNNVTLTKMLKAFKRAKGYAGRNKVISASFSVSNMLSDGGVCRKINQIIDRGAIVVMATHDPEAAAQADGEVRLDDGRCETVRVPR